MYKAQKKLIIIHTTATKHWTCDVDFDLKLLHHKKTTLSMFSNGREQRTSEKPNMSMLSVI